MTGSGDLFVIHVHTVLYLDAWIMTGSGDLFVIHMYTVL